MRCDNIWHERFIERERDSGFVKIRNKLIGITAILIVILFIGMAMQPVATLNQNQVIVTEKPQNAQSQQLSQNKINSLGIEVSRTSTSITNTNSVSVESKLKTINNDIKKSEMGINILYSVGNSQY